MNIIQVILEHKEDLALIVTSLITVMTGLLHILPEPTVESNKIYLYTHKAIHFLSGNKNITLYLDKISGKK